MQKLIQYGMTYTFIRIAITNVVVVVAMLPVLMKVLGDEDTSRIILVILYSISMYVVVINEIYSCTCVERLATMDYKNVIFSISLSFWE